jgi:AAHS family 4-hydroxybenzoate transporter-like MFS transporter
MGQIQMTETIDISQWLNQRKISKTQVLIASLCALVSLLDGFDALVVGYLAPSLIREWHIPPATITSIFVSGLVGIMVGCLLIAPLADWVGRKAVIIGSLACFGILSLMSAYAGSVFELSILRFVTGVGLGGALPNALAMTAEFAPNRSRFTMTLLMFIGFPAGASLAGFIAAPLITHFGWQSVFIVGGILPLILALALVMWLPESIQFLVAVKHASGRVAETLHRIDPSASFAPGATFVMQQERKTGVTVVHLFREGRALGTILLWIIFFASLLDIYLITSWMPVILANAGLSLTASITAGALVQLGGVATTLFAGPLIDKMGWPAILVPLYLLGACAVAVVGYAGIAPIVLMVAAFLCGAGILGGQNTANAIAATCYPTYIRSTGVGWALGWGRLGAVAGPTIGGAMVALHWQQREIFLVAAASAVVAAIAAALMALANRNTPPA